MQGPTHHSFTFNLLFLYELKHKVHLSKTGFSIFDSVSFLLKFIFLFNNMHGLFDLKNVITPFKIKIIEKPRTVLLPEVARRSFKIQLYMPELELPIKWPGDKFFKFRKSKFLERHNSNF